LYAFGKFDCHFESALLRNQIAMVDGTPLLPTADSRSAAVQARPFGAIDIVGLIHERYGRCRISSSARKPKEANVERPCAADGGVGDQRRDAIATVAG
jgi:hypothetical protein